MSLLWPIVRNAIQHPGRLAVIDDRRKYTYAEILGGALFLAEQIESRVRAPRVGIMLPTSGAFPISLMGAWFARKAAVPLNYLLAPEELDYVIRDSGIDTIITAQPMIDFLGGAEKLPRSVNLFHIESVDFKGMPPLRWPPFLLNSDLAVLLYTSGTSGKPKGVMLTHGNLTFDVEAAVKLAEITVADKFLGVLPQFHSFGLTGLTLIPLRVGSTVIYTARFVPRKVVQLIREHRPEIFLAVPSMYGAMLTVKDLAHDDFSSVRMAISGGEPLPQAVYDEYKLKTGLRLLEGYGLTETSPVASWCTPKRRKRHSVGNVLPGTTVLIVDAQDKPVPANSEGEILLAGPHIMAGYYNLPEQTAQVITRIPGRDERFFRTGDIGRIDEQGYLYITGRKKEMLIVGGENVFPREIEEVLNQHPMVKDSAVIGKNDGMRGEVPIAFIELAEGAEFDEAALRTWCRQSLAGYKVPREIRVLDALPRNPTGKIMRRKLAAG